MKSKFEMRVELLRRLAGKAPHETAILIGNFERMQFKDDTDFNEYLNDFEATPERSEKATQEEIDEILHAMGLEGATPKNPAHDTIINQLLNDTM